MSKLSKGKYISIKRKPKPVFGYPYYYAIIILRQIRSVDRENGKILCDDNINYDIKNIIV
jgi:hypothetical protein